VRRCVDPLLGSGRFISRTDVGEIDVQVSIQVRPAGEFEIVIDTKRIRRLRSEDALTRAVLHGIYYGTLRSEPPAWGCCIECLAVDGNPLTAEGLSVAALMAVEDSFRQPGWEPSNPDGIVGISVLPG
jgi:hypothetical protein